VKSSEISGIKINNMLKPKLIEELKKLNFPSEGSVAELKLRLNSHIDREKIILMMMITVTMTFSI